METCIKPKISYFTETTSTGHYRKFTVASHWDKDTGKLRYGASIFHLEPNQKGSWVKKGHRETATARYEYQPVILNFDNLPNKATMRRLLFKYGVKSYVLKN